MKRKRSQTKKRNKDLKDKQIFGKSLKSRRTKLRKGLIGGLG